MNKLWFRRKTYGWGWTPVTWQGWGVTFIYALAIILLSFRVGAFTADGEIVTKFFIPLIFLTALLLFITYKTGETPRWQWGKKDEGKN